MGLSIKTIWILAEYADGHMNRVFDELYTKAREIISQADGGRVCGVVLGSKVDNVAAQIAKSGVDTVYCVDHGKLQTYNGDYFAVALSDLIKTYQPDAVWIGASATGAELAPSVAARLKTGLAAHCVDITVSKNEGIAYLVPAFGGNVIGEIFIPDTRPQMATVRPGILEAKSCPGSAQAEITHHRCDILNDSSSAIELVSFETREASTQKLEEAELVLCAGRGLGGEEYWNKLNTLAQKLNAAVGYTRCVIDKKWVEDECSMIGTSGKSIRPKLYLGFGVSGATHHVCGMNKSGTIISVNNDKNAKVFSISDYKAVAGAEGVIDALLEKLG